jgi:hypothetical protein
MNSRLIDRIKKLEALRNRSFVKKFYRALVSPGGICHCSDSGRFAPLYRTDYVLPSDCNSEEYAGMLAEIGAGNLNPEDHNPITIFPSEAEMVNHFAQGGLRVVLWKSEFKCFNDIPGIEKADMVIAIENITFSELLQNEAGISAGDENAFAFSDDGNDHTGDTAQGFAPTDQTAGGKL